MEFKICVQRNNGWEWRTVTIDIHDVIGAELTSQCSGIGGIDIQRDGFTIESVKASSIDCDIT
jgi:hypothetical protein